MLHKDCPQDGTRLGTRRRESTTTSRAVQAACSGTGRPSARLILRVQSSRRTFHTSYASHTNVLGSNDALDSPTHPPTRSPTRSPTHPPTRPTPPHAPQSLCGAHRSPRGLTTRPPSTSGYARPYPAARGCALVRSRAAPCRRDCRLMSQLPAPGQKQAAAPRRRRRRSARPRGRLCARGR